MHQCIGRTSKDLDAIVKGNADSSVTGVWKREIDYLNLRLLTIPPSFGSFSLFRKIHLGVIIEVLDKVIKIRQTSLLTSREYTGLSFNLKW